MVRCPQIETKKKKTTQKRKKRFIFFCVFFLNGITIAFVTAADGARSCLIRPASRDHCFALSMKRFDKKSNSFKVRHAAAARAQAPKQHIEKQKR